MDPGAAGHLVHRAAPATPSRYRELQQFDQINYGADLSATYSSSPRTTFTLTDTFVKGYTGDSLVLADAGVLLPRTVSKTNAASVDVAHQISPQWTWNVSGAHQLVLFDSDLALDGSTLLGRAAIDRRGARDSVGIGYEFRRDWATSRPSFDAHGPNLRVERRFAKAPALWVNVGARRLPAATGNAKSFVFSGGTGLALRSTKQAIEAKVERSVEQAYGVGGVQIRIRGFAQLCSNVDRPRDVQPVWRRGPKRRRPGPMRAAYTTRGT